MDRREEMLAEHARPMYRALRAMGASEAAAFEGAIGHGLRSDALGQESATAALEPKEKLLREEYRGWYRLARETGASEEAAFHSAIGRSDPRDALADPFDAQVHVFRQFGMSEAAAHSAAVGRSRDEHEARAELRGIEERRQKREEPEETKSSLTEAEKLRIIRGEPIAEVLAGPARKTKAATKPPARKRSPGRARLEERSAAMVANDITDIEAGRRPSDRYSNRPKES